MIIIVIITIIIIITYIWVMGTQLQVPQSNLSNNEGKKAKKLNISYILNGNISIENMGLDMFVLKI